MAGTLDDMKTRIASELARSDLTTQIANAITDAIGIYQKQRYRFNETVPDDAKTFATVQGRATYGAADNANIPTMLKIDYLLMQVANTIFALKREDPERVKLYNQVNTMQGQPSFFAYEGNELIISAVPDQAYTIFLNGQFVAPAPSSGAETGNHWMLEGERLIRSMAKYLIAKHVTRNPTLAQNMSPSPPNKNGGVVGEAWREDRLLKGETNLITGRGIVRPMAF